MPTTLTRSLLVVLIPGLVAVAPWLLALEQGVPAALALKDFPILGQALLFAATAVAGSIFEGLGTHFEVKWDLEREEEYSVAENWWVYLSRLHDSEPVGHRYLARLATTLYFELSMLFAVPIFLAGSAVLESIRFPTFQCWIVASAPIAIAAATAYFWWQAKSTHKVLCETRKQLNSRFLSPLSPHGDRVG
jgi:hypothetical protein